MKITTKLIILTVTVTVTVLALVIVASKAFFIVNEGEQAVVTRFGRILPNDYTQPGLKIKMPFIDEEHIYPKKLLSWDGQAALLPTSDDKRILLDTTARWRIADPKTFYSKLSGLRDAYAKLDDIIDKRVRAVVGRYPMVEIVRTTNEMLAYSNQIDKPAESEGELLIDQVLTEEEQAQDRANNISQSNSGEGPLKTLASVDYGRLTLEQQILELSSQEINPSSLGIELVDVLIRQVQYPQNVATKVYESMASERRKRAAEQRSIGEGEKAIWMGRLERDRQTIVARAEAKAAEIFREAYNKDTDFYKFWRAMDSYEKSLQNIDKVLSTDMDYFNYLYSPSGTAR